MLTTAYIINRTPTVANKGTTSYELLFKRAPNYEHLRTFGCLCYKKKDSKGINKFNPIAEKDVFLLVIHKDKKDGKFTIQRLVNAAYQEM